MAQFLLHGDKEFTNLINSSNLDSHIEYILATDRFDEPFIPK